MRRLSHIYYANIKEGWIISGKEREGMWEGSGWDGSGIRY